jgi:uncharacterized membrane protein
MVPQGLCPWTESSQVPSLHAAAQQRKALSSANCSRKGIMSTVVHNLLLLLLLRNHPRRSSTLCYQSSHSNDAIVALHGIGCAAPPPAAAVVVQYCCYCCHACTTSTEWLQCSRLWCSVDSARASPCSPVRHIDLSMPDQAACSTCFAC